MSFNNYSKISDKVQRFSKLIQSAPLLDGFEYWATGSIGGVYHVALAKYVLDPLIEKLVTKPRLLVRGDKYELSNPGDVDPETGDIYFWHEDILSSNLYSRGHRIRYDSLKTIIGPEYLNVRVNGMVFCGGHPWLYASALRRINPDTMAIAQTISAPSPFRINTSTSEPKKYDDRYICGLYASGSVLYIGEYDTETGTWRVSPNLIPETYWSIIISVASFHVDSEGNFYTAYPRNSQGDKVIRKWDNDFNVLWTFDGFTALADNLGLEMATDNDQRLYYSVADTGEHGFGCIQMDDNGLNPEILWENLEVRTGVGSSVNLADMDVEQDPSGYLFTIGDVALNTIITDKITGDVKTTSGTGVATNDSIRLVPNLTGYPIFTKTDLILSIDPVSDGIFPISDEAVTGPGYTAGSYQFSNQLTPDALRAAGDTLNVIAVNFRMFPDPARIDLDQLKLDVDVTVTFDNGDADLVLYNASSGSLSFSPAAGINDVYISIPNQSSLSFEQWRVATANIESIRLDLALGYSSGEWLDEDRIQIELLLEYGNS